MSPRAIAPSTPRRILALALVSALAAVPAAARAWWNQDWAGRKPLRLDTSAAGANVTEPIGTIPILVRLHVGNFRFESAKEDGSDLRFIAADDRTPLKFHVEKYDALLGEALIWVAVPDLKPGAKTDVWLYYKNPKAVPAEDAKGTYDAATSLVYHFAERGQPPRDASAWSNHATTAGNGIDGALIGRGVKLDGTATVSIPASTSLAWPAGGKLTCSAWVKPADGEANGVLVGRHDNANALEIGFEGGKPYVELGEVSGRRRVVAGGPIAAGGWHHLAVVIGEGIVLYVDGSIAGRGAGSLPALNTSLLLGGPGAPAATADTVPRRRGPRVGAGSAAGSAPSSPFLGEIDELTIANVERPGGFVQLAALSQGSDPARFLVAGQDEEAGGAGSGYLGVIVKSVTLDGWIVIGLLGVMAAVSWLVIATKASYLGTVERANRRFSERFHAASADLRQLVGGASGASALEDEAAFRSSPLYRTFEICAREVRKRSPGGRPLSAEAIEAVRASLDAGLVRENQRLTSRMVLLTIAISGGPFLGLLGTVVGVMITFAAIAAAGDVNVNAIAPGIAAALVATVAGLGVAIPALFAYNWLLARIKNVTATLQVFVDELVTRIAETYAHGEPAGDATAARPEIVAAS
jgi:biopolymer transport protein ExbB